MRINDLVGETTEYDKKLKVELRKPKSWCKSISAFAKIIDNYAFQINYKEDKKPYFRSDRYQFTVIMPNLNYSDKKEDSLNNQNRTDDTLNVQKGADDIINDTLNVQKGASDIINDTINIQKGAGDIINDQDGTDNIINHQSDVKDEIEITMEEIKILEIMKNKPDITIKQLTVILSGISNRTITRNIVILKKKGLLERVGSRKKDYWKVKR
ncbi:HTH domain-containing protein [Catenibacterium mitsuokai]|uniref:HTH domain-containing protein n=1 Tax=Catenibacterium mitsuokai TaxID=100886 RepID=UPI0018AA64E1|nr:HTH domain-containing protein [Catenibacterium mitsuokai]